jgi:type VI protein secretion system component VasK
VYNALKAYLITTVNHDKQWKDLAVVLDQYWKKELPAGSERASMALANFTFYAEELAKENPYENDSSYDTEAVETARAFLNSFPAKDGIYPAEDWVLGRAMAVH